MTGPLRVGLVGAGMVSAFHLPAWKALGRTVELVAMVDADSARARMRADAHGICAVYPCIEDLFAAHRLDAVDIMTPPASHAALCGAAAAAGVAILCQKPLAPTWQEADGIARDVGDRVRLMVHENWRFRPHYRQIVAWLRGGAIGTWRSCTIGVRSSGLLADANGQLPALERQPLLARLARLMIAEVLVHHIDLALWLFGELQVVSAWTRRHVPEVMGESAAQIVLQSPDGRCVVLEGDMADAQCGPTLLDSVSIEGNGGSIVLSGDRLALQGTRTGHRMVDFAADYQRSYDAAIRHFALSMLQAAPFETPPAWHLQVLQRAEDAYRCASDGHGVSVPAPMSGRR